MSVFAGPNSAKSSLILCLDASNTRSYPGSGTTWYDLSGRNNHFTLSASGQSYSSSYNGVITFASTGTASITSTDLALGSNDFTMESWFQNTSTASAYTTIFALGSGTNLGPQLRYGDAGFGDKLQCGINMTTQSSCYSVAITKTSSQNVWYQAVMRRASQVNTFWINAVQQNLGSGANPSTYPSTSFTDGTPQGNNVMSMGSGFTGNISHVKLYNRALSDSEIAQNFRSLRGRFNI